MHYGSRQPTLLVKYLETYLGELKIWLQDWRIAINVGKSVAVVFLQLAAFLHLDHLDNILETRFCGLKMSNM